MINNIPLYKDSIKKVLTVNDFSELKNKTILVTGVNGLIGSCIVDVLNYLNNDNYNINIIGTVRNINNVPSRFREYDINIIEYDVNNELNINNKIDYIINAASNADPKSFTSNPVDIITTNVFGTKNLLDFCLKNNVSPVLLAFVACFVSSLWLLFRLSIRFYCWLIK